MDGVSVIVAEETVTLTKVVVMVADEVIVSDQPSEESFAD